MTRRPASNHLHIPRHSRIRWRSARRPPQMITRIGQETRTALRTKETRFPPVPLGKDDLVEELDTRVVGACSFAFMQELVERLRLAQHAHVLGVVVRDGLEEGVHVEVVHEPLLAALAGGRVEVFAVGVEETGEAADEGGADLVGAEGGGAHEVDGGEAVGVDCYAAA